MNSWEVSRKELLAGLAVVAFLVYANSLGNGFVWDDGPVIQENPAIRGAVLSLFNGLDIGRGSELTPYYRPLTLLSFMIEQRLHGLTPFLVRLFNVLLHCANTFLVFRVARSLLAGRAPALLAVLLFVVHPLQSEGVDFNAGGRNTMLCAFASELPASRPMAAERVRGISGLLQGGSGGRPGGCEGATH